MKTIKQYYSNKKVLQSILNSVENPHLRVWNVCYSDRSYRTNDKRINSIERLKELLLRITLNRETWQRESTGIAVKVWVSIAQFSNPHKFYGKTPKKAAWKLADANMLKSDLLFDFDSEEDLSIAHKDAKKVIRFMKKEKDYELINIRMSGNKGFHLLYKDLSPVKEPHPIRRIQRTEERRMELVNRLPKLKTIDELHNKIICDQCRVHAAINTVKGNTGNLVKEIPLKDFLSTCDLNKYVERVVRPIKPMIEDESILTSITGKERPALSSKGQKGKLSAPIAYPYYYRFVDNRVRGVTESYITVLKYNKNKDVKHLLYFLQKRYNLPEFYKFLYKGVQMYINLRIIDKVRLGKIMKVARCINLNSFLHYGHTWIPITEAVDKDGNIVWERPLPSGIIKSVYGKGCTKSRPHANLFNLEFKNMTGWDKNKVCKAVVEG